MLYLLKIGDTTYQHSRQGETLTTGDIATLELLRSRVGDFQVPEGGQVLEICHNSSILCLQGATKASHEGGKREEEEDGRVVCAVVGNAQIVRRSLGSTQSLVHGLASTSASFFAPLSCVGDRARLAWTLDSPQESSERASDGAGFWNEGEGGEDSQLALKSLPASQSRKYLSATTNNRERAEDLGVQSGSALVDGTASPKA